MAENLANKDWEPKIVAIVCNWCTYAGADLAGISRIQYPPNVRIIRVPCTGRINPFYIVKALQDVPTAFWFPVVTRVNVITYPEI